MILTRSDLRRLVHTTCPTDTDLDALLIDYFPDIKKRLVAAMDRTAKINYLLEVESPERIADVLRQIAPTESTPTARRSAGRRITSSRNLHTSQERSMQIFISHSNADKAVAESFINLLRGALRLPASEIRCTSVDGFRLPAGVQAADQLRQEVFDSTVFIALLSPTSIQSIYVMFELGARWGAKKPLIPILINGFSASSLKPPLSAIHAMKGAEEAEALELLGDIAKQLQIDPEPPAAYLASLKNFIKSAT